MSNTNCHTITELIEEIRVVALDDSIDPDDALMRILQICEDALSDEERV